MKSSNMQHLKAKPSRGSQPPRLRPSFTLVELLIVISIIGIMTGMILFALLGAQTDARVARTRGTIQKLNDIVLQKWEEFRYRPVDITLDPTWRRPVGNPPRTPVSPRDLARIRMLALRDQMRLEMPDRITDLLYPPTRHKAVSVPFNGVHFPHRPTSPNNAMLLDAIASQIFVLCKEPDGIRKEPWESGGFRQPLRDNPAISYPAFFNALFPGFRRDQYDGDGGNPSAPLPSVLSISSVSDTEWKRAVSSAELLYLYVANTSYAGSSALEFFKASEIGDTDGDGLLEFIDAWGQPIAWIRWPAGFPGDLVRYADDDALDPLKTDWRYGTPDTNWDPRTLVPLILSAGPDGVFDTTFDFETDREPDQRRRQPPNITVLSDSSIDTIINPNPRRLGSVIYATMAWPSSPPFGTPGVSHSLYFERGEYAYPDPFFTWDESDNSANGPASVPPYPGDGPDAVPHPTQNPLHPVTGLLPKYRQNQLGSTFEGAVDNITNHVLLLEP